MKVKKIIQTTALSVLLLAGVANAQTDTTSTPSVANTGAGGNSAENMILLATSAAVAIAGTAYIAHKHVKTKER